MFIKFRCVCKLETDLDKGEELVKKLLKNIQDQDLKFLIENMISYDFEKRYTIKQAIDFFE